MPEEIDPPQQPPEQPTLLGGAAPDELFARGMQSVKMTSGTAGTWQPPTVTEAARLFPGYEVLRLLGRGGMGAVYQARQIELDRLVAIKLLPLEISVDKDFADRFRREARAMARLNHPHIITVYDFGTTSEGHLYFVMEFVEGANLADIIRQVGLDGDQSLSIVEQVCTALAYAHGKGIVHRDIKPANVMIDTESHVKVADFGLARLIDAGAADLGHTMTGTVMGTPDYMAPEQSRGMNVDHRADIYSVGVMLYEMLCREVPKGIFEPPSHRTGCDARIDQIVIRAMQQVPDRRYQSTQEMKADITSARLPVGVPAPEMPAQASRPPGKSTPLPPRKPATPKSPGKGNSPEAEEPNSALPPTQAATTLLPSTAVLQAIPPPGSKKSKLPVYGGIVAAVLAAVAALLYFVGSKKSDKAGTPAVAFQISVDAGEKKAGIGEKAPSSASPTTALEPGAIHLWNSKERIQEKPGVRWENNAVRLDKMPLTTDQLQIPPSRDAAIHASINLAAGTHNLKLGLRINGRGADGSSSGYLLSAEPSAKTFTLSTMVAGQAHTLQTWPFPRAYGPDEWVPVGLRAVGDELTVSVAGQTLGTVRDTTLKSAGHAQIFAGDNGHFRDIVYVPLDKTGAPATSAEVLEPGAIRLWDTPEKLAGCRFAQWEDGAMRLDGGESPRGNIDGRDGILHVRIRRNEDAAEIQLRLRVQRDGSYYRMTLHFTNAELFAINAGAAQRLAQWPLLRNYDPDEWPAVEFKAVGDELSVSIDGQLLGRAHDDSIAQAGSVAAFAAANGYFRDAVYVPLDKLSASAPAPSTPPAATTHAPEAPRLSPSTEPWVDAMKNGNLLKVAVKEGAALRMTDACKSLYIDLGPEQDGAVRMLFTADASAMDHCSVVVRRTPSSFYNLHMEPDFQHVGLGIVENAVGRSLKSFRPPAEVQRPADQPIELELRVIGATLVAKANGSEAFRLEDSNLPQGHLAIRLDPGVLLHAVQTLDLSKGGASAKPASAADDASWHDSLAEWWAVHGNAPDIGQMLTKEANGSRMGSVASVFAWAQRRGDLGDVAIRATVSGAEKCYLCLRTAGATTRYFADILAKGTGGIALVPAEGQPSERLKSYTLPPGFDMAARHTYEFRAQGGTLSFFVDGLEVATAHDTQRTTGGGYLVVSPGTLIEKLEYRELPAPPSGAATPAPGTPAPRAEAPAHGPAAATKDAPLVNSLGMKFVPVPITGGPTGGQRVLFSVWETRVRDYEAFVKETRREWTKPPFEQGPTHPAVNVSWNDATAFCAWLTSRDHNAGTLDATWRYRLPSDHEWSCSVGIGDREDAAAPPSEKNRKIADAFPWGTQWPPPPGAGNYSGEEAAGIGERTKDLVKEHRVLVGYRDEFPFTAPVGSFAANRWGLFDLGGNAWEWCEDQFSATDTRRLTRGSSFVYADRDEMLSSVRGGPTDPALANSNRGFRCVLAPGP